MGCVSFYKSSRDDIKANAALLTGEWPFVIWGYRFGSPCNKCVYLEISGIRKEKTILWRFWWISVKFIKAKLAWWNSWFWRIFAIFGTACISGHTPRVMICKRWTTVVWHQIPVRLYWRTTLLNIQLSSFPFPSLLYSSLTSQSRLSCSLCCCTGIGT